MARAMKDSGVPWIGEIPEGWKTIKFKYLHEGLNTGEGIDKEFWSTNEDDKVFYTAGLEPIRTNYRDFPDWKYTRKNDLLLARNGSPYVYFPNEGACYTDHIIRATLKERINRKYVQYCLGQSIKSVVVDSVSLPTWSASIWNEQVIPWSSAIEQQRIADFLDAKCSRIDAVIEQTRASIEEYKKLKQAIITRAVTKGLRPDRPMKDSGIEWIGEIPENWSVFRLKYGTYIKGRIGWQGLKSVDFIDDGPFCITSTDFLDGRVVWSRCYHVSEERYEMDPHIHVKNGDLLISKDGTIGKLALIENMPMKACLNSHLLIIRPLRKYLAKYLFYVLSSDLFSHYYSLVSSGTTMQSLSQEKLKEFSFPICAESEQEKIFTFLDIKCSEIDALINKKMKTISNLDFYKKSLVFEYVTGKRKVL